MYILPFLSPSTCAGVSSNDPVIVPLVPGGVACGDFAIVRSRMRSSRAPGANPSPTLATVAGVAIFSKVPVTDSFLPLRVADAEPMPATKLDAGWPLPLPPKPKGGAGARRALYLSPPCAPSGSARNRLAPIVRAVKHAKRVFFDVIG